MAVTQKQIALMAGVSQPVVARVLTGHPNVAPETRCRVEEVARTLGYTAHTNNPGRALVARRYGQSVSTGTLAVLYSNLGLTGRFQDHPFFVSLVEGIEREAEKHELDACFFPLRATKLPRLVQEDAVDGVICISSGEVLERLQRLRTPKVALDWYCQDLPSIVPDDRAGTWLATRHLIEKGHRRIAYLHFPIVGYLPSSTLRLEGFQQALQEAGLAKDEVLIVETEPRQDIATGARAVQKLLERTRNWTALVCYNDLLAMGAVQALQEHGLRVPEDVSVVGFDDITERHHFAVPLTSVSFDRVAMGRRAVQLLLDSPSPNAEGAIQDREVFPVQLVERQSVKARTPPSGL